MLVDVRRLVVGLLLVPSTAFSDAGDSNIIGGTATTVGEHPTVVALTIGNGICTGTLITPEWVLTAAHCVDPAVVGLASQAQVTAQTRVHFNTVDVFADAGTVVLAAQTIKKSSFSINALGANDIGLIQLVAPMTGIEPSPVNFAAAMAPVGVNVLMVGYGATQVGGGGTVGKQFALDNRISSSCDGVGPNGNVNLLCFSQTDSKGKCKGDSGGPSFATIDGKKTVVGVTSFGDQSCQQFGADTRTDIEQAFLLSNVPELEPTCTADADCAPGLCFRGGCIGAPFTDGNLGSTCAVADDCESTQCAIGPDGTRCTEICAVDAANACPAGFDCLGASGGQGACWPSVDGGGCCDTSGRGGPTALLGFALVGLVWRLRQRR